MIQDRFFTFNINISGCGYRNKSLASAALTRSGANAAGVDKMAFFEHTITVDEFISKAADGHAFCALYHLNKDKMYYYTTTSGKRYCGYPYHMRGAQTGALKISFKRDEFFTGSQAVFVDIDETRFTDINEYIDKLKYQPTAVYMSYSDAVVKNTIYSRRFHMVYVFDKVLNKNEFIYCSRALTKQIEEDTGEVVVDDCGTRLSQYFNGCYNNPENYKTYNIYNVGDFDFDVDADADDCSTNKIDVDLVDVNFINKKSFTIDKFVVYDYDRLCAGSISEDEFYKSRAWENLRQQTKYIYRVEKFDWINNKYQFIDDDYFRFLFINNKVKDGNKRRRKLYDRMCLRRIMQPEITPNEMMVNTIIDIEKYFDNSDGVLNSDFILSNIKSCFCNTIENIKKKYSGEIEYLKSVTKPKRGVIYKNKMAHSRETTFDILDEYYEPEMSVKDNLEVINEVYGFKVSKTYIYEYIKHKGYKTNKDKLSDEDLLKLTDFSLTMNKNYKKIKDMGYKIGNKTYRDFYKQNKK